MIAFRPELFVVYIDRFCSPDAEPFQKQVSALLVKTVRLERRRIAQRMNTVIAKDVCHKRIFYAEPVKRRSPERTGDGNVRIK